MVFDPLRALLGGALIGLAAALLLLTHGRIAGVSGILGGVLTPRRGDIAWRLAFLLGLIVAGAVLAHFWPARFSMAGIAHGPLLGVAGVLVGFGTRIGGGCTSGHGICGLGRGSPRSFGATATFMLSAVLTVLLVRHVL